MTESGISPTAQTYSAVIGACAMTGEWEPALDLYTGIENDVRVGLLFVVLFFDLSLFL